MRYYIIHYFEAKDADKKAMVYKRKEPRERLIGITSILPEWAEKRKVNLISYTEITEAEYIFTYRNF